VRDGGKSGCRIEVRGGRGKVIEVCESEEMMVEEGL